MATGCKMFDANPLLPRVLFIKRPEDVTNLGVWDRILPKSCFWLPFPESDGLAIVTLLPTIYFFGPIYLPVYQTLDHPWYKPAYIFCGIAGYSLLLAMFGTFTLQRLDIIDDYERMIDKYQCRSWISFGMLLTTSGAMFATEKIGGLLVLTSGVTALICNFVLWLMSMAFAWRLVHNPWPLIDEFYAKHLTRSDFYDPSSSEDDDSSLSKNQPQNWSENYAEM